MAKKIKKNNSKKSGFVHLHVHSHYSLLDGLGKVDDLLAQAKKLGMNALALTDHGVMYGAIEFFQKAKEYGIKPIIGCEVYLASNGMKNKRTKVDEKRYHLVLLAKNEIGYKNLIKLVSKGHLEGFYYKPRIDRDLLKKHSKGLIASSACMAGEIPSSVLSTDSQKAFNLVKQYQKIFGKDNFYLELEYHQNSSRQKKINQALIELSKETQAPLIATCDVHYVKKTDKKVQDALLCIQQNKKVNDNNRLKMTDFDLYLKSPQEMQETFKDTPQALENTVKIAEKCNFYPKMGQIILPYFKIPGDQDENEYLRKLCKKGIAKRYGKNPDKKVYKRLDFELSIIKKMGYASYFLIVADFVNWAKKNKIVVGPGRGSAAGSIVSYLTKITNIDPIKYELLFERFLNPERISMPDIDIDFADNRRDEVIEYVASKYGKDKVAQIITFGTMAARNAVRDAGRALDYPYDFCDKIAKEIPAFTKLTEALEKSAELKSMYDSDEGVKKIIDMAQKLEGVARHASTHACGVVITKDSLTDYVPLQRNLRSENQEGVVTQYEGKAIESLGLLKMDFLGLKNLTILQNVIDIIRAKHGKDFNLDEITLDDKKTLDLFAKGETTGVFQFESAGFKRYLKELQPSRFQDLIDMVALYRPGPMDWIPDYIAGKHGKREITYLHPKLKPILEKTYGIIVVQEQVMEIAKQLAGFTAGEADYLRKAMGKKIKKLMDEQRDKFILGCIKNKIKGKTAEKIWDFIKPFAGYGFNWAHSACYAMIGYQTAYFKAHYPVEFMAALLSSEEGNTDRISIEIDECKKMGIKVLPPNINESFTRFAAIGEGKQAFIRYGLNAVKNVGDHIAKAIIKERKKGGKFKSIADFVTRVDDKDLNKKSLESLAKAGALFEIATQEEVLDNVDTILKFARESREIKKRGQKSLFDFSSQDKQALETVGLELKSSSKFDQKQKMMWEKELLGIFLTNNPLKEYENFLLNKVSSIRELQQNYKVDQSQDQSGHSFSNSYNKQQESVEIGGIITKTKKIFTRNNQEMVFAELEDLGAKLELVVFPKIFSKYSEFFAEDKIIWAKGKLNDKDGNLKLLCDKAGLITKDMLLNVSKSVKKNKANKTIPNSANPSAEGLSELNKKSLDEFEIHYNQRHHNSPKLKQIIQNLDKGSGKLILKVRENNGKISKIKLKGGFKLRGDKFEKLRQFLREN
ncbi:MAG: DNA polymerase III subunit alpha [Candidatus Moranbacteria bacterium]|nr:DNA polymerase III subunit alpha [Candidatus Moranbacteria bacterium]